MKEYFAGLSPEEREVHFASLPSSMDAILQSQDQVFTEKAVKDSVEFYEDVFDLANSAFAGNIHHKK